MFPFAVYTTPQYTLSSIKNRSQSSQQHKKSYHMNRSTDKAVALAHLYKTYAHSPELLIANGSTNIIFGHGNADARIVFIGEAPGQQEDLRGEPFVGKSGQLLNKIFEAIGLKRDQVYITNAVKVRPPNNRKPSPLEIERSKELLMKQLAIIQPRIICTLGSSALHALSNVPQPITKVRGKNFYRWQLYCSANLSPGLYSA